MYFVAIASEYNYPYISMADQDNKEHLEFNISNKIIVSPEEVFGFLTVEDAIEYSDRFKALHNDKYEHSIIQEYYIPINNNINIYDFKDIESNFIKITKINKYNKIANKSNKIYLYEFWSSSYNSNQELFFIRQDDENIGKHYLAFNGCKDNKREYLIFLPIKLYERQYIVSKFTNCIDDSKYGEIIKTPIASKIKVIMDSSLIDSLF